MIEQINDDKMKAVLRKVKKLLRLAGGGKDDEGQSALLMAQRLLADNRLSMSDISMGESKEIQKNVVEGDGTEYTRLQWWMKSLANIIGENFRCYSYIRSYGRKTKIIFLGLEEDIAIAKTVYDFALSSIKFHSDAYCKRNNIVGDRAKTMAIKNDYISGYLSGLQTMFKEQVAHEGWGLVLVKDALVVKEMDNMKLGKAKATKASRSGDDDAVSSGYEKGKQFSTGRKKIGG